MLWKRCRRDPAAAWVSPKKEVKSLAGFGSRKWHGRWERQRAKWEASKKCAPCPLLGPKLQPCQMDASIINDNLAQLAEFNSFFFQFKRIFKFFKFNKALTTVKMNNTRGRTWERWVAAVVVVSAHRAVVKRLRCKKPPKKSLISPSLILLLHYWCSCRASK